MKLGRRTFLGGAAASFFIGIPRGGYAGGRRPAASDRLNLAVIGCGTMANRLLEVPHHNGWTL